MKWFAEVKTVEELRKRYRFKLYADYTVGFRHENWRMYSIDME